MNRSSRSCTGILLLAMSLVIGLTMGVFASKTIEIVVSPNVLNLESEGGVLTIHADLAYSLVSKVGLEVNKQVVPILYTFPDSRGDLVVKCSIQTVKNMVSEGTATFDLSVTAKDGETYFGTDTITVIARGK